IRPEGSGTRSSNHGDRRGCREAVQTFFCRTAVHVPFTSIRLYISPHLQVAPATWLMPILAGAAVSSAPNAPPPPRWPKWAKAAMRDARKRTGAAVITACLDDRAPHDIRQLLDRYLVLSLRFAASSLAHCAASSSGHCTSSPALCTFTRSP